MARGGRYHAIDVDRPDEGEAPVATADPMESGDPAAEEHAFLPDKPLSVPAMRAPGAPPAVAPAPAAGPSDAPDGSDLNLPDKPSKLADLYNSLQNTDPDRAAKVLQVQKRMNAPAEFIDKNLPDIEKAQAAPSPADWADIETKLPGTTAFLSKPQNMAIAKDDIQNLAHHEMILNHAAQAQTWWDAVKVGWQNSVMGLGSRQKLPDLALPEHAPLLHSLLSQAGGLAGDALVMGGGLELAGPIGAFALPAAIKTALRQRYTQGEVKDLPDLLNRSGEVLKESAKQGIVGWMTAGAGRVVGPLAEAAGVYLPVTGVAGLASRAATTGAPLAAESAMMEFAGKGVEGQTPTARGVLENALTVGTMHALPHAIGEGSHMAGRLLGLAADARKAEDAKASYLAAGEAAKDSKILARDPDLYGAHVAEIAKASPDRFIEPEAFAQYFQGKGIDPDQAAAELGLTDQLNEAKETGQPIKIPVATLLKTLAKSEHYAGLADDIKTAPDAPSVRQVRDAQAEAKSGVEEILKRHADDAKAADQQAQVQAESPIYRGAYDQLVAAGRDHEEAHANATVYDQTMKTLSARMGTTPEDLAARFPVHVQETEAPADAKSPYDPNVLATIRDEISAGDAIPGGVTKDAEGYVTGRYGSHSTFPEYFKNKGYSKEAALSALERASGGYPLSDTERALVHDLYQSSGLDRTAAPGETAEPFLQRKEPVPPVSSVDPDHFADPSKRGDVELPHIDPAYTAAIGKPDQPVLLKERVVAKNRQNHKDISPGEDAKILHDALYEPTHIIQDQPNKKPDYWVFAHQEKEHVAVMEMSSKNDRHEIVSWRKMRPEDFARILRRAKREGGQVLVTDKLSPEGAAGLPALPPGEASIAQPGNNAKTLESPEFKAWFGDSKVLDEAGKPLAVYHGTAEKFSVFKRKSSADGYYFTDNKSLARDYAKDAEENAYSPDAKSRVIPSYLKMENPLIVDDSSADLAVGYGHDELIKQAKEGGHDGVIIKNTRDNIREGSKEEPSTTYIAFDPAQIKHATKNRGSFDSNDPNIYHQRSGDARELAPAFYSRLTKTVEDKMGGSATVQQINGMLKEIKPEERKYSGLDEFLAGKDKVSKEDLLNFLAERQIQVREVTKGAIDSTGPLPEGYRFDEEAEAKHADQRVRILDSEGRIAGMGATRGEAQADLAHVNRTETKFSQYTLPGGENYREVLFTLPESQAQVDAKAAAEQARMEAFRASEAAAKASDDVLARGVPWDQVRDDPDYQAAVARNNEAKARAEALAGKVRNGDTYRSSHWDEPNVLAHTRLSDRVDAEGKRVLHVEEIQSDWHQEGRKKGYSGETVPTGKYRVSYERDGEAHVGTSRFSTKEAAQAAIDNDNREGVSNHKIIEETVKNREGVPDAPFKKTWHEFVMKRLLRMAAEGGYDKLAWTKGAEQAERYDLSKQVDSVVYHKNGDGTLAVSALKDGKDISAGDYKPEQLEGIVGKDLAEKIIRDSATNKTGEYSGVDLKVGGEGMKGFYDKILPEYLNKYAKKWGAKVGETEIASGTTDPRYAVQHDPEFNRYLVVDREEQGLNDIKAEFRTQAEAERFRDGLWNTKLHSIDITPAMKDAVLHEGQTLFQPGEMAARGRIRIGDQGSIIDLFKGQANASTPLHEFGHYYLNVLDKLAADPSAPEGIRSDMKTIRDWMGLKEGEAIGEDHHEKWARGFEAFLREGKAPSRALEGAFRRFKTWLTALYRKASQLNVEMTPEIRDVMSRMMASEDAVEAASAEIGYRVDDIPDAAPGTKARIRTLQEQARDIAERQLLKEQMPELRAQHKEFLAKEREKLTAEAEAQVREEPLYAAIDRLNTESGKKDAAARATRFLKAETSGRPIDPAFEAAAEIHGFESGKDLAWKIVDAAQEKRFEAAVKARVDLGMEVHAPLMDTAALREKALEAIHNDKQTEYLALEREALMGLVTKKLINQEVARRKRIDASVAAAAAKEQAREILDGKPIREATASRTYVTAERNAAVKAAKALASGDHEKAADYKRQQMLNSALAREAMRNRDAVEKSEALLHKYASRGADLMNMPYGFIRHIDQMLSLAGRAEARTEDQAALLKTAQDMAQKGEDPYRIANATGYVQDPQGGWAPEGLPAFMARINQNFWSAEIPDSVMNAGPREADSLTLSDLKDLHAAVGIISDIGKKEDRFLSAFIKADIMTAAREIGTSIGKNVGSPYARELGPGRPDIGLQEKAERMVRKMMDGLIPSSVNMQTLAKFLDKGDDGPVHQYLYRSLKHAEDSKFGRWQTMRVELEKLISDHFTPKEFAGMSDKSTEMAFTEVPGRRFNLEERLSILLNWGNEGNRDRIRRGFQMNDEQVNRIIGSLDEKHGKFAQAVWDHLQTYWPEIKALEMKVNGVEPKQVERSPVDTQYGTLEGGYYPIAYDFEKSQAAFSLAEQKTELFRQFSAAAAQTDRGHAEARVATFARPVRLSMDVFFNHLENVVHDLEFRPAVIDTARMLNQPEVKAALEGATGIRGAKSWSDWLKACASDQGENLTYVQKVLQWTRFRTSLTSLGLRPLAIIRHLPGNIWNGMQEIGSYRMLNAMRSGLTNWVSGNGELHEYVFSRSERMANRLTAKDRDLSDMARKWTNGQKSPVIQYAFFFQHLCDEAVALPLWHEIYNQNLAEHGEGKAVDLADEAVNRALGSGTMVDRIGAQRGGQFSKLLTMNYSWMSVMMNRAWLSGKMAGLDYNAGNTGQAVATMAKAGVTLFAVPALLEVLAQEAIRNAPSGGSPDEKKRRILSHAIDMPFQYVLGVRDIAPPIIHKALGEQGGDYKLSPVEQALQSLLTPIGEGLHIAVTPGKHVDEKYLEHSFHAAAQLTGTPQQLNTWAFNLLDDIKYNGQATWRDLMTRKAKK